MNDKNFQEAEKLFDRNGSNPNGVRARLIKIVDNECPGLLQTLDYLLRKGSFGLRRVHRLTPSVIVR
jgi:hypothetical protein